LIHAVILFAMLTGNYDVGAEFRSHDAINSKRATIAVLTRVIQPTVKGISYYFNFMVCVCLKF